MPRASHFLAPASLAFSSLSVTLGAKLQLLSSFSSSAPVACPPRTPPRRERDVEPLLPPFLFPKLRLSPLILNPQSILSRTPRSLAVVLISGRHRPPSVELLPPNHSSLHRWPGKLCGSLPVLLVQAARPDELRGGRRRDLNPPVMAPRRTGRTPPSFLVTAGQRGRGTPSALHLQIDAPRCVPLCSEVP